MKILFTVVIAAAAMCGAFGAASSAQVYSKNAVGFGVEGEETGVYCNIAESGVCVIARDEGDCTKLGGEKVEACAETSEEEPQ